MTGETDAVRPQSARDRRLSIEVLEEQERYAMRRKDEALRRGDDHTTHQWDEVKANSRDAAAALRADLNVVPEGVNAEVSTDTESTAPPTAKDGSVDPAPSGHRLTDAEKGR